jgi:SAM-dependent methyltransferase
MSLRDTFDATADRYDAARPDYPDALYDDLVALAGIRPGDHLLEVGCATGKATRPLLARGYDVTGVELGPRLAAAARGFRVVNAAFEDWRPDRAYDLVYAATAWHWVDRAVRYQRAHAALRPGGHLAFWSAQHAFPPGFDPFFTEIQPVYDAIGEPHPGPLPPPPPDQVPDETAEIEGSGLFDVVGLRRHVWHVDYTAGEYLALLDTFSGHLAMSDEQRGTLYAAIRERLGDRLLRRHWLAILHVARAA